MLVQRTKLIEAVVAAAGLICGGCVGTTAPHGWLPTSQDAQTNTYGAWSEVCLRYPEKAELVHGELIAVHEDSLFVLTAETLMGLSRDQLRSVRLTTYQPEHGRLSGWTALGSVSTLSHGVGLVLTFPLWVIVGSATTAKASGEPDEHCQGREVTQPHSVCWQNLSKFARFPQGIPPTVDRSSLKSKPFDR
jgi:hypothetical protein